MDDEGKLVGELNYIYKIARIHRIAISHCIKYQRSFTLNIILYLNDCPKNYIYTSFFHNYHPLIRKEKPPTLEANPQKRPLKSLSRGALREPGRRDRVKLPDDLRTGLAKRWLLWRW